MGIIAGMEASSGAAGPVTTSLADWLATPLGRYLLAREQAWFDRTVADIFGYQQKEGGASYTGAITSITTTTTTGTPEPSSVTLFIAGLVAFGLAKGSRVQRRVSAIRGVARW